MSQELSSDTAELRSIAPSRAFVSAAEPDVVTVTVKRCMDIIGASLLLVVLSPVLLILSLLIRGGSSEPVLFAQPRVGRHGRPFKCYKFRTMIVGADQVLQDLLNADDRLRTEWEISQKLRRDPRVTRIGNILRRSSLDELPQLFNVLIGDMSLVGPRPVLPEQVIYYGRSARWYYAMRPGMTGLWQVMARGNKDFRRRVALDCFYVRHVSLRMDFVILLKTIGVVVSGRGAY